MVGGAAWWFSGDPGEGADAGADREEEPWEDEREELASHGCVSGCERSLGC